MLVFGGVNTIVWTCCFHHDFENHRDLVVYQGREDKVVQVMSCYHLIITCIRYICRLPLGCLRFEEVAESHLGCKKKQPLKSCRIYKPSFKRFAGFRQQHRENCAPKSRRPSLPSPLFSLVALALCSPRDGLIGV